MSKKEDSVVLVELKVELDELLTKHRKLGVFMGMESFLLLPTKQKDGMEIQFFAMGLYAQALERRIADLEESV